MENTLARPRAIPEAELQKYLTPEGLKAFLASPYVKGIGKVYAGKIAERYGFEVLEPDFDFVEAAETIPGIGKKTADIKKSLETMKFDPKAAVMLYSAGLNDIEVEKILSHYGRKAAEALIDDPYDMVENAWKVSFFTADKLGKRLGIADADARRIR